MRHPVTDLPENLPVVAGVCCKRGSKWRPGWKVGYLKRIIGYQVLDMIKEES